MAKYIDMAEFRNNLEVDRFGMTDVRKVNEALERSFADVVERKRGKWEFFKQVFHDGGYWDEYGCSECDHKETVSVGGWLPNFCPNCGADMRGGTQCT